MEMENSIVANHVSEPAMNHVNGLATPESKSGDFKKPSSDGHKHHSSSGTKHHSSSSHKSSSSSSKDKHREHSSSGSSKDKHHGSSSSSSKHKSSSGSHKDKHHSSSSSHKSKDGSSGKDKHHSSSSSSKDPPKSLSSSSSSSKDKHHSSSSSKDKHHSSSSKHKDGKHHSSSSEKHRDKQHGDKDKNKERSSGSEAKKANTLSPDKKNPDPRVMSPVRVKLETGLPSTKPAKTPLSPTKVKVKEELMDAVSDDDIPLSARKDKVKVEPMAIKRAAIDDDDDDQPLAFRAEKVKKLKKENVKPEGRKRKAEDDEDFAPKKKKKIDEKKKVKTEIKSQGKTHTKRKGAKEEETKWKWWEEDKVDDGRKWTFLEHRGPVFAPGYDRLPRSVKFFYNGKELHLSEETEEVASMYAKMLEHEYTTREIFNKNFFKDWRKVMNKEEREIIVDLTKCDFRQLATYYAEKSEDRKNMTKEDKNKIKETNAGLVEEYGFCTIDGHKQKIGNFRIEPPGLFRGRGDHPKQGMHKRRSMPGDVIINCSKDAKVPPAPGGAKWKEVRHDPTVTWLACWTENIQGSTKYVMLNAASRLKGEKDWQKYETARKLYKHVDRIRAEYRDDFKSKEMRLRQRSVALYFIDKLALRAGNEKDEDQADTVGCCSLRVEHITLHEKLDDQECVVEFDFLGKDSIRYYNKVSVEKRVFKNLQLFKENKQEGDDLFDRLNTAILNKHLQTLMEGLTAKVFRTFNASRTLQEQMDLLTNPDDPLPAKMLSYNRANRAVAVLCNHQRAVPKNFDKQMENLQVKIDAKKDSIRQSKKDYKASKSDYKAMKTETARKNVEKKKKVQERLEQQLTKLEVQATDKDENKEIALGTSKLNYLDPRISVAWCKKWDVPIEKIYNKTQRDKFAWAIDMADEDFRF